MIEAIEKAKTEVLDKELLSTRIDMRPDTLLLMLDADSEWKHNGIQWISKCERWTIRVPLSGKLIIEKI